MIKFQNVSFRYKDSEQKNSLQNISFHIPKGEIVLLCGKSGCGKTTIPKPTKECTNCGICAAECPVQAIDQENSKKVDEKACISCMRCISVCPQDARKVNPVMLSAASLMLKKVCSERKACELFL